MSILGKIFTWWDGATVGTLIQARMSGRQVGADATGNVYFEGPPIQNGMRRRWVIYQGANDASRIPPDWHSWMHHQIDDVPDVSLPPPRRWEKEPKPNLTGTNAAYRPAGALEAGGQRAAATGDYEAWDPNGL